MEDASNDFTFSFLNINEIHYKFVKSLFSSWDHARQHFPQNAQYISVLIWYPTDIYHMICLVSNLVLSEQHIPMNLKVHSLSSTEFF